MRWFLVVRRGYLGKERGVCEHGHSTQDEMELSALMYSILDCYSEVGTMKVWMCLGDLLKGKSSMILGPCHNELSSGF